MKHDINKENLTHVSRGLHAFFTFMGVGLESRKKQLKKAIVTTMGEYKFPINNLENTRSRRNYNCYRANYPSMYEHAGILKPKLVVETYVAIQSLQQIADSGLWD